MWTQAETYPDPSIEILDKRFEKYRLFNACVEKLATGCRWSEGPVWFGAGRYMLWSDIPPWNGAGSSWPSAMPMRMQRNTQTVR